MTEVFGDVAHRMPLRLVEPVEKMINRDIRYRPTALAFSLVNILRVQINTLICQHLRNETKSSPLRSYSYLRDVQKGIMERLTFRRLLKKRIMNNVFSIYCSSAN